MFKLTLLIEIIISLIGVKEIYFSENQLIGVFSLLICMCTKLVYYVLQNKSYSKFILLFNNVIFIIAGLFFYPIFLFLAINFTETIYIFTKNKWYLSFLTLGFSFILPVNYIELYIIFCLLGIIIVSYQVNANRKIEALKEEVFIWKTKNRDKKQQLDMYKEYNNNVAYQSQLEERNFLTQKLHDELGHTLSGNVLRLEAVKLLMAKDTKKASDLLQEVIINLRQGMEAIRDILKNAKPEKSSINILDIKVLVNKVQERSKINIELEYTSDIDLIDHNIWKVINLNIKEALTNMMKYSKATQCKISFKKLNKIYKVSIHDNGIGCLSVKKELGLDGMEQRMAAHGNIVFDGSDGFSVVMLFNL